MRAFTVTKIVDIEWPWTELDNPSRYEMFTGNSIAIWWMCLQYPCLQNTRLASNCWRHYDRYGTFGHHKSIERKLAVGSGGQLSSYYAAVARSWRNAKLLVLAFCCMVRYTMKSVSYKNGKTIAQTSYCLDEIGQTINRSFTSFVHYGL